MLYSHLLIHAEIYIYICWIHTDAIIIKTPDDNDTGTNDARRKEDAGRLLYKIFYLTYLFVCFERIVPSLRVRESWRPNITEIFWPQSYGHQRCVFLVLHGCSTGPWSKLFCVLASPTTTRLPPSSTVLLALLLAYLPLSSIRRPYITFKHPRSNIDTPQRLRNLFQRPGCVTSFRYTTLNGIFGRVKRSKHNNLPYRLYKVEASSIAHFTLLFLNKCDNVLIPHTIILFFFIEDISLMS